MITRIAKPNTTRGIQSYPPATIPTPCLLPRTAPRSRRGFIFPTTPSLFASPLHPSQSIPASVESSQNQHRWSSAVPSRSPRAHPRMTSCPRSRPTTPKQRSYSTTRPRYNNLDSNTGSSHALDMEGMRPITFVRSDGDVSRDFGPEFGDGDGMEFGSHGGGEVGEESGKRGPESIKDDVSKEPRTKSVPRLDELNTLLRHPTLYDPVLVPRFPIVLCHGLYGFDVRGPTFFRLHYWGDLLKILRGKVGAEVFVTAVPGTGAVKQRAHVLHQSLTETPEILGRDLNFVGHSMGGLDARYLISNIDPSEYHPRSLTTLSTPHRGSEFMSWCRANIGIGTDFDKTSEAAARLIHEDPTAYPLPYSLKSPILSRAQVDSVKARLESTKKEAKEAVEKVKRGGVQLPGLPSSLSVALSGYLLDLLDSPAYANLTPSFLQDVFNPSTLDKEGVKYYSVAARADKIGIWHPLWLPKMVLDGAAEAREANGIAPPPPEWRGNDGLVTIESAQWGEFLGTLENCDHWELRGSSGLIGEAGSKIVASVGAVGTTTEDLGEMGDKKKWSAWQDVYALVGKTKANKAKEAKVEGETKGTSSPTAASTTIVNSSSGQSEEAKGLALLASWISRRLPTSDSDTIHLPPPAQSSALPPKSPPAHPPTTAATPSARMLYGAPQSTAKPDKFNLERLALALCRKLHAEGL